MDRAAPLPPLPDQTPTWATAAELARAWELNRLAEQGVELVDVKPRAGLFGIEVAFIHPHAMHGVLAELVAVA